MITSNNVKILFLWAEIGSYVEAVINQVAGIHDVEITVVYWDKKFLGSGQHEPNFVKKVSSNKRSSLDNTDIMNLATDFKPDITVTSGWMDSGYLKTLKILSAQKNHQSVCAIDDIWFGSIRQRLGVFYFKIFYKKLFDIMWVSGQPQHAYASHFGYSIEQIRGNLLSCDTNRFSLDPSNLIKVSKRFIFVGRFVKVKNIHNLIAAFKKLNYEQRNGWTLELIGTGPENIKHELADDINVHNWMSPNELCDFLREGGVGCIPSTFEPWGVVLHEFVSMGLPCIVGNKVGAATEFVIDGYNGFILSNTSEDFIHRALLFCINNEILLEKMSIRSTQMAKKITTEKSVATLMSLKNNEY